MQANLDSILARVEELEKQVKALKVDLDDLKDLQMIGKMDVINLKNDVEGIEMINPEVAQQKENEKNLEELHHELREIRGQLANGGLNVCRNCGNVISRGTKFCAKCGGKI